MQIQEQRHGAVTVIRPIGSLALGEAEELRARLGDAVQRSLGRLALDASGIGYVDSLGLEVLVDVSDELAHGGRCLRVCGASDMLREVLDLTGLTDRFEFYLDANAAARSFL